MSLHSLHTNITSCPLKYIYLVLGALLSAVNHTFALSVPVLTHDTEWKPNREGAAEVEDESGNVLIDGVITGLLCKVGNSNNGQIQEKETNKKKTS